MLPINQVLNSQRMLATGVYQLRTTGFVEDVWLIKYLSSHGKERAEVFNIWLEIFLTKERNSDNLDGVDSIFDRLWRKASAINQLKEYPSVKFFQEEIDLINEASIPMQVKQFALLFLSYCKFRKKYKYDDQEIEKDMRQLQRYTVVKQQTHGDNNLTRFLKEAGLIAIERVDTEDRYLGGVNTYDFRRITYARSRGKEIFSIATLLDVTKYFGLLYCRKTCPVCGAVFDYTLKTKTDLCPNCQKEKRCKRVEKLHEEKQRHEFSSNL